MNTELYLIQDYEDERMAAQRNEGKDSWRQLGAMGLFGEGGEVAELVKKHLFHGKDLDHKLVVKECGDVLWYATFVAHHCGAGLAGFMGVAAFRDFNGTSIFSGPEGLLMATGSMGCDIGRLQHHLLFAPYNGMLATNREFIHHLTGVIWSLGAISKLVGSNLEQVAIANNLKLRERYPQGFSKEAARHVANCPACGSQDLVASSRNGIDFHQCAHCNREV